MTPDDAGLAGPIRTCVGCRGRGSRSDLIRVVLGPDGHLLVDEGRRAPGRGAWIHPDPGCLDQAERRRVFGRALRAAGAVDLGPVRAWFDQRTEAAGHGPSARKPSMQRAGQKPMGTR